MLTVSFNLVGLLTVLVSTGAAALSGQLDSLNDSTVRPIPAALFVMGITL